MISNEIIFDNSEPLSHNSRAIEPKIMLRGYIIMKNNMIFTAKDLSIIRNAFSDYLCTLHELSVKEDNVGSEYPAKCLRREADIIRKWYEHFARVEYKADRCKEISLYVAEKGEQTIDEFNLERKKLFEQIKELQEALKASEATSDDLLYRLNRLQKEYERLLQTLNAKK